MNNKKRIISSNNDSIYNSNHLNIRSIQEQSLYKFLRINTGLSYLVFSKRCSYDVCFNGIYSILDQYDYLYNHLRNYHRVLYKGSIDKYENYMKLVSCNKNYMFIDRSNKYNMYFIQSNNYQSFIGNLSKVYSIDRKDITSNLLHIFLLSNNINNHISHIWLFIPKIFSEEIISEDISSDIRIIPVPYSYHCDELIRYRNRYNPTINPKDLQKRIELFNNKIFTIYILKQ